jgi:hypothetical protein
MQKVNTCPHKEILKPLSTESDTDSHASILPHCTVQCPTKELSQTLSTDRTMERHEISPSPGCVISSYLTNSVEKNVSSEALCSSATLEILIHLYRITQTSFDYLLKCKHEYGGNILCTYWYQKHFFETRPSMYNVQLTALWYSSANLLQIPVNTTERFSLTEGYYHPHISYPRHAVA